MTPNSHFKELLSALNRSEARYLVVGGYAVMLYTEPRYTKNLEICVDTATDNAVPPTRIDVLTSISGVAFGETWERRTEAEFGDAVAHSISLDDLLQDKRISGRPTELADYRRLEEAKHLS